MYFTIFRYAVFHSKTHALWILFEFQFHFICPFQKSDKVLSSMCLKQIWAQLMELQYELSYEDPAKHWNRISFKILLTKCQYGLFSEWALLHKYWRSTPESDLVHLLKCSSHKIFALKYTLTLTSFRLITSQANMVSWGSHQSKNSDEEHFRRHARSDLHLYFQYLCTTLLKQILLTLKMYLHCYPIFFSQVVNNILNDIHFPYVYFIDFNRKSLAYESRH